MTSVSMLNWILSPCIHNFSQTHSPVSHSHFLIYLYHVLLLIVSFLLFITILLSGLGLFTSHILLVVLTSLSYIYLFILSLCHFKLIWRYMSCLLTRWDGRVWKLFHSLSFHLSWSPFLSQGYLELVHQGMLDIPCCCMLWAWWNISYYPDCMQTTWYNCSSIFNFFFCHSMYSELHTIGHRDSCTLHVWKNLVPVFAWVYYSLHIFNYSAS